MGETTVRIRDGNYQKIGAADSTPVSCFTDALVQVKLYEVELAARSPSNWRIEDTAFTRPW
ncbi:hypothetical protein [Natronobacterium texcoconense]|uniref:Uncharacterized protein n=1 Tax=Natronobacterium texcoconense TaxID=1095778 RepID=A0A1H1AL32_NATTX|nr:hypothetical protein [Natronobacterium texcoconense]SDQ40369.1 hypothetical protein SAMN04489842_0730 [Natronobacterium texcoconense]